MSKNITFLIGHGSDYLLIHLKDGGVSLTINQRSGKLDTQVKPAGEPFNDNVWHQVTVTRETKQVQRELMDLQNISNLLHISAGGWTDILPGTQPGDFIHISNNLFLPRFSITKQYPILMQNLKCTQKQYAEGKLQQLKKMNVIIGL